MFENYNTNFSGTGFIIDNNNKIIASNYQDKENDIKTGGIKS